MLPLVRRSARFAIGGFNPLNRSWILFHPSPGIWKMRSGRLQCFVGRFAPLLHSLGFRHLPSDSLLLRLSSQVLRIQKAILHPLVHLGDGPTIPLRVRLGDTPPRKRHSSRQGSDTPPRKRRRLSDDSSGDEGESSSYRRQRDDQQEDEENFRPASLALLLDYIIKKFPAASKPLVQPSSKRFHVFEAAGLVDESSQRSSNLAWFEHMRTACDSAQTKFESRILEGRSLSTLLPSVSRTEKVSDSPCQGKALKVNSQVYDLMSSKPSESRSVPLSVREAAGLETTLRSIMESYNFQLWTMTALFRLLGESGHFNLDDPLLDQFQRSFSRGTENVAAGMASAVAFVTTKRRESFLSHMVPSVTDAQKCKLLSYPLFHQKDLFVPATIEAARQAARDVSLYRGAQSRPSTSFGTTQRRPFSSSSLSRGRPHSSPLSTPQRSPASSSSKRFPPQKKSSDPPKKRGGFRR